MRAYTFSIIVISSSSLTARILCCLVLVLATWTSSIAAELDLIILAGQSNAQGWQGNAEKYPTDPSMQDLKIPFYWKTPGMSSSEGKWSTLQKQGGRFAQGHFGLEVSFARALLAKGGHPAVFKYTLGSTSIADNWKLPGKGGMYDDMVKELTNATSLLRSEKHTVRTCAFIWIQGESDASSKAKAMAYEASLLAIIDDLRNHVLQTPDCLVILGLDEKHKFVVDNPAVITAQQNLAKNLRFCVRTSMLGLEKADSTHLTPAGLVLHGERIFQDYSALIATSKKSTGK